MRMKTGLVLEGGAMRGIYTAGVLDAFMDQQVTFDGVMGVSAGAIHGASYVSGQRGRSIRYYLKHMKNPRFMSFWSLLTTGNLVGTQFCYHDLPEKLDVYNYEAFAQSQCKDGKSRVYSCGRYARDCLYAGVGFHAFGI